MSIRGTLGARDPSRALPGFVFLAAVSAAVSGCSGPADNHTSATGASVLGVVAAPASSGLQVAPEDALLLWKRTLLAARTVAGVAKVTETRFAGTGVDRDVVQFSVIEGEGRQRGQVARYRLTYMAPDPMKGVVILNDGRHVWRYSAHKRLVARQASITAPIPPELEEGVAAAPIQADGAHPEIETGPERVAGRATQVLALRTRRSGRIVERRWIDKETGRTMRLEQYAGRDAHIVRRVEVEEFRPLKATKDLEWAATQFLPAFPNTARVVESGTSHARHLVEAEDVARRLELPLHVRGFALRSVNRTPIGDAAVVPVALTGQDAPIKPDATSQTTADYSVVAVECSTGRPNCGNAAAAPALPTGGTTQLYYSKGNQAISIFASDISAIPSKQEAERNRPSPAAMLVGRQGWGAVSLPAGCSGFARALEHGSAVAWSGPSGNAYVAITHMPLSDFLPVVRAFVADRDDAPTAFVSGR